MDRGAIVCRLSGAHFRDIGIVIPPRSGTDGRRNGKISFCRSDGKCTRMRSPIFCAAFRVSGALFDRFLLG